MHSIYLMLYCSWNVCAQIPKLSFTFRLGLTRRDLRLNIYPIIKVFPRHEKTLWFLTRSDTNWAVQPQRIARDLNLGY